MLIALPALLLVVGCNARSDPPTAAAPTSAAPRTSSTTSPPTTSPPTTSAPTTTTGAPFTAADGRNLNACADGICEVFVQTGDSLPNVSGVGPVRIDVRNGMIAISHGPTDGMASSLSGYPGMPQRINSQVFLIVAVQGDQGVLRLSRSG